MLKTEQDLLQLFAADEELMTILKIIRGLALKDSWLCAGSIRNFIWNALSGRPPFDRETDLDVIFFDPDFSDEEVKRLEQQLQQDFPAYRWELRNQVSMHCHSPIPSLINIRAMP